MIAATAKSLRVVGQVVGYDRAWTGIAVIFAALALIVPAHAVDSFERTAENLIRTSPFMVLAILLLAYLRASGADALLARAFIGRTPRMILFASIVGTVTPLCGVEVLPLVAELLALGVPLSAVMAFWVSSPITDPPMYAVTVGVLGLSFANAKTLAALVLGLAGGFATLGLERLGAFASPMRGNLKDAGCGVSKLDVGSRPVWRFWSEGVRRRIFREEAASTTLLITKWLTLAFVLESLMIAYIPAAVFNDLLGDEAIWAIPVAVAVGVPAYVHGYAALPLVAGLLDIGMSPGAAMAFLLAGAITSIPAAVAVYALVRMPVLVWYLLQPIVGSLLAGYAFALYVNT